MLLSGAHVWVCVCKRERIPQPPPTVLELSTGHRSFGASTSLHAPAGKSSVSRRFTLWQKKKEKKKAGNKRPTPQMRANTLNPWQTFLHERCTIAAPPSPSYSGKVAPLSLQQRVGYRCGFVRAASTVRKQIEPDHRGRNESIHAGPRWRLARSVAK